MQVYCKGTLACNYTGIRLLLVCVQNRMGQIVIDINSEIYKEYRRRYINSPKLKLKYPVDISLELSSKCNLACQYCYHGDPKALPFRKGFMSTELACKILVDGSFLGVNSVKMNWRGESTLHPKFHKITKLAKLLARDTTYIERISNSNFMFNHKKEEIFQGLLHQTKVKVSYDSFSPKVMESQRKKSKHKLVTANIDKFYNYPGRDNELVIQAVRTSLNAEEDIEHQVKKVWPNATVSVRDVVEGRKEGDIDGLKVRDRDDRNRQTCVQAHARLIFGFDGIVSPCCPDVKQQLVIGDARIQMIPEIFARGKALRKALKNKKAFKDKPCTHCSSFESYKGWKPPCHS